MQPATATKRCTNSAAQQTNIAKCLREMKINFQDNDDECVRVVSVSVCVLHKILFYVMC